MRMRQSLSQLEEAFHEETFLDRDRRESLRRQAVRRARKREVERQHRLGSVRFIVLVLGLITTALIVTVVMFKTLYVVMG